MENAASLNLIPIEDEEMLININSLKISSMVYEKLFVDFFEKESAMYAFLTFDERYLQLPQGWHNP